MALCAASAAALAADRATEAAAAPVSLRFFISGDADGAGLVMVIRLLVELLTIKSDEDKHEDDGDGPSDSSSMRSSTSSLRRVVLVRVFLRELAGVPDEADEDDEGEAADIIGEDAGA